MPPLRGRSWDRWLQRSGGGALPYATGPFEAQPEPQMLRGGNPERPHANPTGDQRQLLSQQARNIAPKFATPRATRHGNNQKWPETESSGEQGAVGGASGGKMGWIVSLRPGSG